MPPITQQAIECPNSSIGSSHSGRLQPHVGCPVQTEPSMHFQPKLRPPAPAGMKSTSSIVPLPTSPMNMSPVRRSNEKRHGLRRPSAQTSSRTFGSPTKGLLGGMYGDGRSTSKREILPLSVAPFCALPSGGAPGLLSAAPPPSPSDQYSMPSLPNCRQPALCCCVVCGTGPAINVPLLGSARFGFALTL